MTVIDDEGTTAKESALAFARMILKILEGDVDKRDAILEEFLGVKRDKMTILSTDYAAFQRSQAIYAMNMFPTEDKNCKIIKTVNMTDEGEEPPFYERIKVKRKKRMSLMTVGEFLLEYKGVRMVLESYFCGYTLRSSIYASNEVMDLINEFQDRLTKYMRKHNFLKGEKLVLQPQSDFDFLEYPKLDWDDVVLKPEVREAIMLNVIFPLKNRKSLKKKGVAWRRGILMGGIAGTGKTQVCRILCNVLPKGVTLIWATPKALFDTEKIRDLFDAARYFSPTLLVIEDIDFIGQKRDFGHNTVLGELLTQLDGNDPNHGVFVLASTNRPDYLDEALANRPSRFDVKVEFPLPETSERKKLIELFTKDMEFENPNDIETIISASTGLTGAHIREIFVYAQIKALKEGREKLRTEDVMDRIKQSKVGDASGKYRT